MASHDGRNKERTAMTQPPPNDAGGSSSGLRRFRFGAGGEGNKDEGGARKFVKLAQTAEEYGYDTFAVPDHLATRSVRWPRSER